MAAELICFLAGALVLMAPGIVLAVRRRIGRDWLDRCTHGCCLGLALAIYLASLISHFDLRWFYPAWIAVGIATLLVPSNRATESPDTDASARRWTIAVLLLVAITRFGVALPQPLPNGVDPPEGHLILAEKIQMTHHAVSDWQPFSQASVTYPTGSHVLIAVWSSLSRLPVATVFKDLIPLLGLLSAAQVFVFTRRISGDAAAGLYAAFAYGFWAAVGSIDFYNWGGLPNELAILLLLSMLSVWKIEEISMLLRLFAMAILYAAMILSHHHTQVASAVILLAVIVCTDLQRRRAILLVMSVLLALLLDVFFLVPYLMKVLTLASTNALHSEQPMHMDWLLIAFGYAFLLTAAAGMILYRRRQPALFGVCIALIVTYLLCEYVLPIWLSPPGHVRSTVLAPSHFLNDLTCFLAVFAGMAIAHVQRRLALPHAAVLPVMLLISISQWDTWRQTMDGPRLSSEFLQACAWIRQHTPPNAIVLEGDWGAYLSWRRPEHFHLADSEQRQASETLHIERILTGQDPFDSEIVQIDSPPIDADATVLWQAPGGLAVVRVWPK
ncbi:MAG TPA: hypothetical protein VL992_17875 [Tepidisphaeraceae bacterium]|nr:hypothetical protein [Tepidisphaeraceae bacterium]